MKPKRLPIQRNLDLGFNESTLESGRCVKVPEIAHLKSVVASLEKGGFITVFSPAGAGVTEIVRAAVKEWDQEVFIHTCVGEETDSKALIGLLLSLSPHAKRLPNEKMPRRTVIEDIATALMGKPTTILVVEHLELEPVEFSRYLVAIRDRVLQMGGSIRIVAHFTRLVRKGRLFIAQELRAAAIHSIEIGEPDPSRVSSIFAFHLRQKPEFRHLMKMNDPVAKQAGKLIYEATQGDLRRVTSLARKLNHFYGDHPLDFTYFQLLEDFLQPQ